MKTDRGAGEGSALEDFVHCRNRRHPHKPVLQNLEFAALFDPSPNIRRDDQTSRIENGQHRRGRSTQLPLELSQCDAQCDALGFTFGKKLF